MCLCVQLGKIPKKAGSPKRDSFSPKAAPAPKPASDVGSKPGPKPGSKLGAAKKKPGRPVGSKNKSTAAAKKPG